MFRKLIWFVSIALLFCLGLSGAMAGHGGAPTLQFDLIPWGFDFGQWGKITLVNLGPTDGCSYEYLMVLRAHGLEPGITYTAIFHPGDTPCAEVIANGGGNVRVICTFCCDQLDPFYNSWGPILQSKDMYPGPTPVYILSGLWVPVSEIGNLCLPFD